jgi:hypothetical protein
MSSVQRKHPKEEFARRGDAIYENQIRPNLKPEDNGKFLAIDIETGAYEVADSELEAGKKLREKVPQSQTWMIRIGSRYVHRFGGRQLPRPA